MTRYAAFDPSASSPQPVTGWYDTGFATYKNLPPLASLVVMTDAEWTEHMKNPSRWIVLNGKLVEALAPPASKVAES